MAETCEKSQTTNAAHCWHRVGNWSYTTDPPQHDETCCYCGEKRRVVERFVSFTPPPGHGPFAPRTTIVNRAGPFIVEEW